MRQEIVHNRHVVRELADRGAVFVETEEDVPRAARVVLSAHGVAPEVHRSAPTRGLRVLDATCPLVTKVHAEARRFAAHGYTIVLVGHAGHEEVIGTMGEAPESILLVDSVDEIEALESPTRERVAYITQTTLSVDETRRDHRRAARAVSRRRSGRRRTTSATPPRTARTRSRSWPREVDLVLVIGSRTRPTRTGWSR